MIFGLEQEGGSLIAPMTKHIDGLVQIEVTPVLTYWGYVFPVLTHRYIPAKNTLVYLTGQIEI